MVREFGTHRFGVTVTLTCKMPKSVYRFLNVKHKKVVQARRCLLRMYKLVWTFVVAD